MITITNHGQPKSLTGSALKRASFRKAMNNMACAAGLGAITGTLTRDYYQLAINALDQAEKNCSICCSNQSSIEKMCHYSLKKSMYI